MNVMKKITLLMFALIGPMVFGQMTFDLDWEIGVSGAAASFTIETGDTMRWTWADALPHSVTNQAGSQETFDSGILTGSGTEFSYTFTEEGTNPYQCDVHPGSMFGTITVEAPLSIDDKFASNIQFFPNPVEAQLTIVSLYRVDSYSIHDISGRLVGQGAGNGTYTQINSSNLETGMYFVTVISGDLQATLQVIKK